MTPPSILITGGAGYVGSHVLRVLLDSGKSCIVLDDLSKGCLEALPQGIPFYQSAISNQKVLTEIFGSYPISGIMHFAGFIEVGESMKNPEKYFINNLSHAMPLLEQAKQVHIPWIVFSSSAAVYGEPRNTPIGEDAPKNPNNPYGITKWLFEEMLRAYDHAFKIRSISLRYFNAAGAHPSGKIGENHQPESHLIPRVCKTALGKMNAVSIFGNDYPTPDGTCIRDYIHVMDLAQAHLLAAEALQAGRPTAAYNLGSETGYSVKQVIEAVSKISGRKIPVEVAERRPGDAGILVASSKTFQKEFSWKPKYELTTIIQSAWAWHESHPEGFTR